MRVRYTLWGPADLAEIYEFLERRHPAAAQRVIATIERQVGWLADFPYMAPATDEAEVRELTLARYPYKIYYEVVDDEVRVLHIRHARKRLRERKR